MLNNVQHVLLVNCYFLYHSWQIWTKEREKERRYLQAKILKHIPPHLQPSITDKPLTKYGRPHGNSIFIYY